MIMAAALVLTLALLVFAIGRPISTLGQAVTLIVLIGIGLATYAVSLHRFGIIDLPDLLDSLRPSG
jgi:hypothetical protein